MEGAEEHVNGVNNNSGVCINIICNSYVQDYVFLFNLKKLN